VIPEASTSCSAGLPLGEAQIRRTDLGELVGQAQLMQPEPQVAARGQHRVHVRRKVRQQTGELGQGVPRMQLMQIVDDQDDTTGMVFELR